jgi:hypothetical protein
MPTLMCDVADAVHDVAYTAADGDAKTILNVASVWGRSVLTVSV